MKVLALGVLVLAGLYEGVLAQQQVVCNVQDYGSSIQKALNSCCDKTEQGTLSHAQVAANYCFFHPYFYSYIVT